VRTAIILAALLASAPASAKDEGNFEVRGGLYGGYAATDMGYRIRQETLPGGFAGIRIGGRRDMSWLQIAFDMNLGKSSLGIEGGGRSWLTLGKGFELGSGTELYARGGWGIFFQGPGAYDADLLWFNHGLMVQLGALWHAATFELQGSYLHGYRGAFDVSYDVVEGIGLGLEVEYLHNTDDRSSAAYGNNQYFQFGRSGTNARAYAAWRF
jgi:hypothetical protein